MKEECSTCKYFWDDKANISTYCRRYPPVADVTEDDDRFPLAEQTWWCGEWKKLKPDIPEVEAYEHRDGINLVVKKCPYCGEEHWHGKGYGHRVAHCTGRQGNSAGYILVEPKDKGEK